MRRSLFKYPLSGCLIGFPFLIGCAHTGSDRAVLPPVAAASPAPVSRLMTQPISPAVLPPSRVLEAAPQPYVAAVCSTAAGDLPNLQQPMPEVQPAIVANQPEEGPALQPVSYQEEPAGSA